MRAGDWTDERVSHSRISLKWIAVGVEEVRGRWEASELEVILKGNLSFVYESGFVALSFIRNSSCSSHHSMQESLKSLN